jgi:hypothetical protein
MVYYIYLAAAVIVIIGIGAAGIVLVRRRARAIEEIRLEALGAEMAGETPLGPKSDAAPEPAREPAPEPAPVDVPLSVPVAQTPAAAEGMMLIDPLGTVILDLVDGRDKLTMVELKRLDVFRPDRIESAIQSIQFPPRLLADEEAAFRLAQIQLYAASLGLRAKWSASSRRIADAKDSPLTTREFKLKIARDILDLPASDRSEIVGYLLGGLLGSPGSSTPLKRAIVDTLEHLRSAALVNVLLDCLDDPDPIIREYALAAADRLLDG